MVVNNSRPSTESALTEWRYGSTQAERLCATILHSEGYSRIDPQSPLGGPDGRKDVRFILNGWRYIAAVYFPPLQKEFKEVRTKFSDDLSGVGKNHADGITFFTNQRLTPSEREELESLAKSSAAKLIIYHLESVRAILDSPRGYGMRLEYLRLPMNEEEQLSFISQFSSDFSVALGRQSAAISDLVTKVSEIHSVIVAGRDRAIDTTSPLAATMATRATPAEAPAHSDKEHIPQPSRFITQRLDTPLLCYLHTTVMEDVVSETPKGELRRIGVWIGAKGSTPESARFVPPSADKVPSLVAKLLDSWRSDYDQLMDAERSIKVKAIVSFHYEFLRIHPFLDGNGRVARILLEQQARELLNVNRRILISDSHAYFEALQAAHAENFEPLTRILNQAIFGEWPETTVEGKIERGQT